MDSSGFYQLVKNFTNLTPDESAEAARLTRLYPYSQILHILRARAARDLSASDKDDLLNVSAVYSTDRGVLKQVMTLPRQARVEKAAPPEVAIEEEPKPSKPGEVSKPVGQARPIERAKPVEQVKPAQKPTPSKVEKKAAAPPVEAKAAAPKFEGSPLSGDALREDLYNELEKLKHLKHDFELSVEAFEKGTQFQAKAPKPEVSGDALISEIKTSRKKAKNEAPTQVQAAQGEIIDEFIKKKPVMPKPKAAEATEDLSEDSAVLGDNAISETLVNLLIKQGKKDKAIEVLKKLIWKFPQKKAYFAAQIEALKE